MSKDSSMASSRALRLAMQRYTKLLAAMVRGNSIDTQVFQAARQAAFDHPEMVKFITGLNDNALSAVSRPEAGQEADKGTFAGIDPDALYTTAEASALTKMSVAFYEVRRAKDLPPRALSVGRYRRYSGADLIAFLKGEDEGADHV